MKIIFDRQKILNDIAPLMCAVSGKSTLTAIEGILIEAKKPDICIMTTYDLEKGVRITTEAKVLEEGTYIINAQKFSQTMKVMNSEEITLTVDSKLSVCIESGKSSYKMSALEASDFPTIPNLKSPMGFTLRESVLKEMISQTSYAMGVNDQRTILNGTYFLVKDGKLMMVTCDSFKLAKCTRVTEIGNGNDDGEEVRYAFIVPIKTINELSKLLSDDEEAVTRIYYQRKYMVFEIGDIIFFSRLIEGEYIDYNRIIVKDHRIKISMDREDLISALERAALVTEERIAGNTRSHVRLDINGHLMAISANSAIGSTYDEVEINHEGEDMFIAFNNRYLIDSVRACRSDRIVMSLSSALTSINIEPEENEEGCEDIFMLLPVRMKDQV
jgi:DNA polymerase-3 subunit beta